MSTELPIVDFTIPESEAVEIVDHACRVFNAFLVNPSLPNSLYLNLRETATHFFALPEQDKLSLHRLGSGLGYLPEGVENLAATIGIAAPPDPKETFNVGPDPSKNRWPIGLPQLEEKFLLYYSEMERISHQLMRVLSLALGMPMDFLENQSSGRNSILRATRYPALGLGNLRNTPLRAGPHTDYGMFSLVQLDHEVGGFEIKPQGGDWIEVRPAEGLLVVNIGDLLMRWTNGSWPATLHRVAAPPAFVNQDRFSLVFLHNPRPDTIVAPLKKFLQGEDLPRFEPVVTMDYLKAKSKAGLGKD